MILGNVNTEASVFVIAEAGNNHEGDFSKALDLVDAAAETGADAIKFQTIIPEKLVSIKETQRIAQLKRFQLSLDQYFQLSQRAQEKGIQFLTTPFDIDVVDELDTFVSAYKVASGDLTWHRLLKKIASKQKPLLLSTGGANLSEVQQAVRAFKMINANEDHLAILHCVMAYPAPADQLNLNILNTYRSLFKNIGYSDHFLGLEACIAAVALGARVIEKHFTLDKQTSSFRDHQLSADPLDMKNLVATIRTITPMLGSNEKLVQQCEQDIQKVARRSPKVAMDIKAGHTFVAEDVLMLRPCSGLSASIDYIGQCSPVDLNSGDDLQLAEAKV